MNATDFRLTAHMLSYLVYPARPYLYQFEDWRRNLKKRTIEELRSWLYIFTFVALVMVGGGAVLSIGIFVLGMTTVVVLCIRNYRSERRSLDQMQANLLAKLGDPQIFNSHRS